MCKKINIFAPVLFGFYIIVSILFSRIIYSNSIALPLWLNLMISQCILLIPALIYVLVMKIDIIKCIPYRKIKLSDAVSSLLIGYCLVPLVLLINSSTTEISQYPFIIQLLLMAFLPTIAEEFVFRGLFYHSYRKNGILGAAILSGVVFGAIHLNINQFCYACVMGMVFALMVEITGSMFSSMLAHFAVNSYSIIMLKLVSISGISVQTEQASQQIMSQYSGVIILLQIAILAVTAIAFFSIAYLLFMSMAKRNGRWDYFKLNMKKGLRPQNNEHFITIPLAATLLAAAAFMIFQELA